MFKKEKIDIILDFDGTCVTHEYPRIGRSIGAEEVLLKLVNKGHNLILFTMRDKKTLNEAVNWFKEKQIPLFGIQRNPTQNWTTSPKAHGQYIIDDICAFMPLKTEFKTDRFFINWELMELELIRIGLL